MLFFDGFRPVISDKWAKNAIFLRFSPTNFDYSFCKIFISNALNVEKPALSVTVIIKW